MKKKKKEKDQEEYWNEIGERLSKLMFQEGEDIRYYLWEIKGRITDLLTDIQEIEKERRRRFRLDYLFPDLEGIKNIIDDVPPPDTAIVYLLLGADSKILKLGRTKNYGVRKDMYLSSGHRLAGSRETCFAEGETVRLIWAQESFDYEQKRQKFFDHEWVMKQFFNSYPYLSKHGGHEWFAIQDGFDMIIFLDELETFMTDYREMIDSMDSDEFSEYKKIF